MGQFNTFITWWPEEMFQREHFCCTGHQKRRQLPGGGPGPPWEKVRRENTNQSRKGHFSFSDVSTKRNPPPHPTLAGGYPHYRTVYTPPDTLLGNGNPAVGLRHGHAWLSWIQTQALRGRNENKKALNSNMHVLKWHIYTNIYRAIYTQIYTHKIVFRVLDGWLECFSRVILTHKLLPFWMTFEANSFLRYDPTLYIHIILKQ